MCNKILNREGSPLAFFNLLVMKNLQNYITGVLLTAASLAGCHRPQSQSVAPPSARLLDSATGSCSFVSKTPSGEIMLSWIREDSGATMVWYAAFDDTTGTFVDPRPIPPSRGVEPHGENMPKMVFLGNGRVLAMYGVSSPTSDNPYTGTVYYTWSSDSGRSWSASRPLFRSANSFDQRYFDIARLPSGQVGAIWLNNSEQQGSTLYFAATGSDGSFGRPTVVATHTCQCCRTDLFCDSQGLVHVAWRAIIDDSIRDMEYCYSRDTGKTFSMPTRISRDDWVVNGCPHTGPSMAENKTGLHFAWFTMGGGGGVYYCHTTDTGRSFSPRQSVSDIISARHPEITALPMGDLAIVWDEGGGTATRPRQRIGLQMRGPGGLLLSTRYVSSDSASAYFPQIAVIDPARAVVAYTEGAGPAQRIWYRTVSLKR